MRAKSGAPVRTDRTHTVATKKPNPFGLYDVLGNVFEYCEDVWRDNYGREGKDADLRVARGGCYRNNSYCQCDPAYRNMVNRWTMDYDVGLRPAASIGAK